MGEMMGQFLANSMGHNGHNGTNCHNCNGEGINLHIPTRGHAPSGNRVTTRPLLPQVLEGNNTGSQRQHGQGESFNDYLREYRSLGT